MVKCALPEACMRSINDRFNSISNHSFVKIVFVVYGGFKKRDFISECLRNDSFGPNKRLVSGPRSTLVSCTA